MNKNFLNALAWFNLVFGFFVVMAQESYWCLLALFFAWISGSGVMYFYQDKKILKVKKESYDQVLSANNSFAKLSADMETFKSAKIKSDEEYRKHYEVTVKNYETEISELNRVIAELTPIEAIPVTVTDPELVNYVSGVVETIAPTKKKYFKKKASK